MHCSASGKLFIAHMPPAQRNRLLEHLRYQGYTPNTITSRIGLEAEIARVRAQGYALDNEEFLAGLVCVAVPVFDANKRKVRGSVAVQAPASRFPIERATSALPALQRAAESFALSIDADAAARPVARPPAPPQKTAGAALTAGVEKTARRAQSGRRA